MRPRTNDADRLLLAAVGGIFTTATPSSPTDNLHAGAAASAAADTGGSASSSLGVGDGDEEQEERECGDGDRRRRLLGLSGIFGLSLSRRGGLRVMTGFGVPFRIELEMWGPTT